MTIFLDFDGTVVEHEWPRMGRCNFGCFEIIKKVQDAGHEIVLNTYRANAQDGTLLKALDFLNYNPKYDLRHITEVTKAKIYPASFLDSDGKLAVYKRKEGDFIFIDDQQAGIPLKPAVMVPSQMVDWEAVDKIFIENNIYDKSN